MPGRKGRPMNPRQPSGTPINPVDEAEAPGDVGGSRPDYDDVFPLDDSLSDVWVDDGGESG
jgi:hypothetical protein